MQKRTLVAKIGVVLEFKGLSDAKRLEEISKILEQDRDDSASEMASAFTTGTITDENDFVREVRVEPDEFFKDKFAIRVSQEGVVSGSRDTDTLRLNAVEARLLRNLLNDEFPA